MTDALRDHDDQAGSEPLEQAETDDGRTSNVLPLERAAARARGRLGIPAAEAKVLGDYNLHNG